MAEVAPRAYRYVLLKLGPITITKRSVSLAVALAGLTFTALQAKGGAGGACGGVDGSVRACVRACVRVGGWVRGRRTQFLACSQC